MGKYMKSLRNISAPKYTCISAWTEHVPFYLWIADQIAPRTYVELGTHYGMSYFAFCQAILESELCTKAFSVDTWHGDDHAGFYDESVYESVSAYNNSKYKEFSTLLRMTFKDAVKEFEDGSIDLLHIDGRHGYEDVKEDFYTWLSKLSDRAIVIFHNTEVQDRGFGVSKFWAELEEIYPSFNFVHGHGLGVLAVGEKQPETIKSLFSLRNNSENLEFFQSSFEQLGGQLSSAIKHKSILDRNSSSIPKITKVKLVIATREKNEDDFLEKTATGKSIKRLDFGAFGTIDVKLFTENVMGLPRLYNAVIKECNDDSTMLVFLHDDLHILSFDWIEQLIASMAQYQIVGLAGNKRRVPGQGIWLFPNNDGKPDLRENLSGKVAHGNSYPCAISYFGPVPQQVKLLDGLMLCGMSKTFLKNKLFFDERFDFHFYDLDLCRSAEIKNIKCGTWPVSVVHESGGNFGSLKWRENFNNYIHKWGD
jgi:GT2 family glycosyltransferase